MHPPNITKRGDWQARAAEKRDRCTAAIPEPWRLSASAFDGVKTPLSEHPNNLITLEIARRSGILSEVEIEITESFDVATLLKKLATGELSSVDVTIAFSKRAAVAQQLVVIPHDLQPLGPRHMLTGAF